MTKLEERNKLVEDYYYFAVKCAVHFQRSKPDKFRNRRDDLIQSALVGLIEAADFFDSSIGIHFSTYAKYFIKKRLINASRFLTHEILPPEYIYRFNNKIRQYIQEYKKEHLEEPSEIQIREYLKINGATLERSQKLVYTCRYQENLFSMDTKTEEQVLAHELLEMIDNLKVSDRDKDIFLASLQDKGDSLEEIGKRYGITRQRVSSIKEELKRRIIAKIR